MKSFLSRLKGLTKKKIIVGGITIIILILIGFFAFGSRDSGTQNTLTVTRGEFVKDVSVSGKVVASQTVDLSFAETDRVTRVDVKVGDRVTTGQTLASLVSDSLFSQLEAARAALAQKQALNTGSEVSLDSVRTEQDTLVKNAYQKLLSNDLVAVSSVSQTDVTPPTISGLYTGSEGRYKITIKRNFSARSGYEIRVFELENLSEHEDVLSNQPTKLGTKGLFISFPDEILDYNDTTWYISIPNVRSSTYLSAYQDYQEALRTREREIANASSELTQGNGGINASNADIQSARAEVARVQAQIAERTISAPFTGIVTKVDAKVGSIASANTPAISMISDGTLQIESYVPEIHVPFVKIGDNARVTLDAYGDEVELSAKVVSVDPAETVKDGVSTYRTKLEFTVQDPLIKSGMTANVVITAERRQNVIAIPQRAVMSRDGKKFVTVQTGDTQTEKQVTTAGVSSFGEVEITSGLEVGDVVVLTQN